jgi:hypothetical protein
VAADSRKKATGNRLLGPLPGACGLPAITGGSRDQPPDLRMAIYRVSRLIGSAFRIWASSYEIDGITFRQLDSPPAGDGDLIVSGEAAGYQRASTFSS